MLSWGVIESRGLSILIILFDFFLSKLRRQGKTDRSGTECLPPNFYFTLLTGAIGPNGPAVCFSRRNPTTAPGRVLVPRASGADKLSRCKEDLARVFAVMVQILLSAGAIAVQF